jgi:hypothetical protein
MKVCERPDLAPSYRAIVGNNGFERIEDSKGTLKPPPNQRFIRLWLSEGCKHALAGDLPHHRHVSIGVDD